MSANASALRAFAYLQAVSAFNGMKQRLLRLRQPKYLFGAVAGVAYVWFFFLRRVWQASAVADVHFHGAGPPPAMAATFASIAALALFVIVVVAWLVPSDRAALKFSEAEVAFLFPAPLSRKTLVHFSLLRAQTRIFVSAFLMTLVFRRGAVFGGSPIERAIAIWLVLSTLNLHFLGASFVRERLLDFGVRPALRRMVIGGLLLCVGAVCWWWLQAHVSYPGKGDLSDALAFARYAGSVLGMPPVSWLLAPFKALAGPLFATDADAFARSLAAPLALLIAHYAWVMSANVSFEEASIDYARRQAERSAARGGRLRGRNGPKKPRSAPFVLSSQGTVPVAFLWKGLIAMGPFWRLRTWLVGCAVIIGVSAWMAADEGRKAMLVVPGTCAAILGAYAFMFAPMLMQRGMRRTMEQLDILKAGPLRGWQIALGELLTPICIMSFVQWLLLIQVALAAFGLRHGETALTTAGMVSALFGVALVLPPLCGLMLCVPFAAMLYFPAWIVATGSRSGGFEVMGQRLIFLAGYVVALLLVLLAPAGLGGLTFLLVKALAGMSAALFVCALIACAVLVAELAAAVDWLGRRIDGFDVSQELR